MNKQLPNKFPRISRIINERFFFLVLGASFVVLAAIIIVSFVLYNNAKNLKDLKAEREALILEKTSWENILSKYPDYRDGYLTLANIEYRLSEKGNALLNVRRAIEIDPNFSKSYEFEKYILNN